MIDLWKLTYVAGHGKQVEWYASEDRAKRRVVDLRYTISDVEISWIGLDPTDKGKILALLNTKDK